MKWLGLVMVAALPALALAGGQDKKGDHPKPADAKPADAKPTEAKLEIGKAAPAFELKDLDGKAVKLADYKGKTVVLEWFNPECPFVVHQHSEGVLKDAAAKATKDGVVWLAINSSGPGKEGNGVEKNKKAVADWKMAYPVLVDEDGTVGMAYGSKNTPTMYIIDAKGMLAYHGAIDNASEGKPEGGTLVNYVENALAELKAGKAVSKPETKPYGCGVKYAKPKS
jgi:peroxiredoxin